MIRSVNLMNHLDQFESGDLIPVPVNRVSQGIVMATAEPIHVHDHEHEHSENRSQAWMKVAILVGLGLYFGAIIVSGDLANYINARFAWLSYVAAALFLLLGAASAYSLLRQSPHHADHEHHDHQHLSWPVLGIVAIPLVLGTLIPSQPLGAEAVDGNISLSAVSTANATAFTVDPLDRNILDWLRLFNSSADLSAFNGQESEVIGFVYREPTFPEGQFMVARFTISCCVADSSAIGLVVNWPQSESIPDGEWVRVQGTFEAAEFREDTVPIVQATAVEVVEQPEHPYLYP